MIRKATPQTPEKQARISSVPTQIHAKIEVVRQDIPEQASTVASQETIELYADNAISMLRRETSEMSIGIFETVVVTVPIRAYGLLSYYVISIDDTYSLSHHVQSIDTTLRLVRIVVSNQTSVARKFIIAWL